MLLRCIALYIYFFYFSILLEVPIFQSACVFFLSVSQYVIASRKDNTQITHLKFTQAIKKNGNDNFNCMQKLYLSTCTSLPVVAAVHIGRSTEQISWCMRSVFDKKQITEKLHFDMQYAHNSLPVVLVPTMN